MKCWGYNGYGQLTGTTSYVPSPQDVSGLTSGVAAIATGVYNSCAITTSGGLKCWGYNVNGLVGNGSTASPVRTPADVVGLSSGVVAVAIGYPNACALTSGGAVKCWGSTYGSTPTTVSGLISGAVAIGVGYGVMAALKDDGSVVTWGDNQYGQGGNGSRVALGSIPRAASAVTEKVVALGVGYYTSCAITEKGSPQCWGNNYHGQLGDGTSVERLAPAAVTDLPASGVAEVALGDDFGCARMTSGAVKCWGANAYGQVGDGSTTLRARAVDAAGLTAGVAGLAMSRSAAFARRADGSTVTWGSGVTTPTPSPALGTGHSQVVTGDYHQCVLTSAGGVKCVGANNRGQLGNGSLLPSATLVDVTGLTSGVKSISARGQLSCAVTTGGGAKCWGDNASGILGNGSSSSLSTVPVDVSGLTSGVDFVAAHSAYACAALVAGGVMCWGNSSNGRLGNGVTSSSAQRTPIAVDNLTDRVTSLGLGADRACGATSIGSVLCWGRNYTIPYGGAYALPTYWYSATDYPGLTTGIASISASPSSADPVLCAVTTAGGVVCVGPDWNGVAPGVFPGVPRPVSGFVP
jgi:alpha-tubulin suppressor-like RCC1 family protein